VREGASRDSDNLKEIGRVTVSQSVTFLKAGLRVRIEFEVRVRIKYG
jgi:hypothetical protein